MPAAPEIPQTDPHYVQTFDHESDIDAILCFYGDNEHLRRDRFARTPLRGINRSINNVYHGSNKVPVNNTKFEDVESIMDPISKGKVTPHYISLLIFYLKLAQPYYIIRKCEIGLPPLSKIEKSRLGVA